MVTRFMKTVLVITFALMLGGFARTAAAATVATISNDKITLEFDQSLRSRVSAGQTVLGPWQESEVIILGGKELGSFTFASKQESDVQSKFGSGKRLTVKGTASGVEKIVTVDAYREFPAILFLNVEYRNTGRSDLRVDGWVNARHELTAGATQSDPPFWSLLNGSYEKRPNWIVPLRAPFHQENYLGMNASDYGGGTPVLDIWRKDVGLAIGHDELTPKLVSFPVDLRNNGAATFSMKYKHAQSLKAAASLKTFETFISVHEGDAFRTLESYRRLMVAQGVRFDAPPAGGFDPIWCAWGFGRNFTPEQILNALPMAKKLGFAWVGMDDGWQTSEGDWRPNPAKFPRGDADVRALVDKIHAAGLRAQLWWSPMSVSPKSDLFRDHPDWMLLDPSGARRKISWWNSYYLCPAYGPVVRWHAELARKAIRDWGFDGLKMDGQFLNAVPPCTNPAHHHERPEDSVEAVPYFFKAIADAVKSVKPDALIELCPCGTAYSFYTMPYYNMTVASDPESSFQIRSKGKTLKALMGDGLPYFGDHVELSDGGMDFASTVGVGGVVGSNFRWPPNVVTPMRGADENFGKLGLSPQKEKIWTEWVEIYKAKMLSKGEYLGELYDIGFDRPETHAIRKGDSLYYAFYAPQWSGPVELRGLKQGTSYKVVDYVNNRVLGTVNGPTAKLPVQFERNLLIEADPQP